MIHRKLVLVSCALGALTILPAGAASVKRASKAAPSYQFNQTSPATPAPSASSSDNSGYTAAPVPNRDAFGPQASRNNGARFSPDLFAAQDFNKGDGYLNGSTVGAEQRAHLKPTPGFRLDMPLQ